MTQRAPHALFLLFVLSVVFSVQFPLPLAASQYASVNLSDFVLLAIAGLFVLERLRTDDWRVTLSMPTPTTWFLVAGGWMVASLAVAAVRSPGVAVANALWTLKWFEVAVLFVFAQAFADRVDWNALLVVLTASGIVVALTTVARTLSTTGFARVTAFWHNPNTLAVFLALPALLCLVHGAVRIRERPGQALVAVLGGFCCLVAVVSTGSRSGLITLVVGVAVATTLSYRRLSVPLLVGGVGTGVVAGGALLTTRPQLLERFLPTIAFREGSIVLSGAGTGAIYGRYELTRKALDLWTERPVFGYGWFASPENSTVSFLDVFYTQVLVDLGLVGFVLVGVFYLVMVRTFVVQRTTASLVVPTAGGAWLVGLLAAGIGGGHPRIPRIMFLLVLVLVAANGLRRRGVVPNDRPRAAARGRPFRND
ncbi:O-antigen ligase family protein [Haloarcula marina]|uniref:O-antigen ligase family protein n=1 Tax=Haloarcula marina TaxID=2961574 RepID=UPI0020B8688E|nr:O-antigen ligase family protein [Halomicroarcula marina]